MDPRIRIDIGCVVRRREGAERGEGIVVDLSFSPYPQARVRWFWDDTTLEPLETNESPFNANGNALAQRFEDSENVSARTW